jgi:hypothetical protein
MPVGRLARCARHDRSEHGGERRDEAICFLRPYFRRDGLYCHMLVSHHCLNGGSMLQSP